MKTALDELAEKYLAYVGSDSIFQRRLRVLQSIWRTERGYAAGEHNGRLLGSRLPMPWARETLSNYLTPSIRHVVRNEVSGQRRNYDKLYSEPRIFNDLLSSQPLCFNLFAELQQDLALATAVFKLLTAGRVDRVIGVDFEHSPGRGDQNYTGDRSAFDVFITYETLQHGRGFIGIEVKYHENLKGVSAQHRPRYDEIADIMGCFKPELMTPLRNQPLQQIWRDHLLAGSLRQPGDFDDGFFVFLYPKANDACANAVRDYETCLSDRQTFTDWTLEDAASTIQEFTHAGWISHFVDRYLNYAKLQS